MLLTYKTHSNYSITNLVNILKVEPSVEWSDGQVQVWQLELCYTGTDVSLICINTKRCKAQAVFVQSCWVHGDGETLIEDHCECICLNLWEEENNSLGLHSVVGRIELFNIKLNHCRAQQRIGNLLV